VEEQSIATKEIAKSVAQTAAAAEVVSRGVTESASASQEITQSITSVDSAAERALSNAGRSQHAGVELLELSQQIHGLVAQFQV
jgi:methyl-accepting chemotaxis protein